MLNKVVMELNPTDANPRNSEGAFLKLKDGRIIFIYTHFYGGKIDDCPAYLAGRYSLDRGMTWSDRDEIVVENQGGQNVMSVSLLRLVSGRIAMFYLVKNSIRDCRCVVRFSDDECRTWSEPVMIMDETGYYTVNNDRVIQTRSGRLIIPAGLHAYDETKWSGLEYFTIDDNGHMIYFLSDDEGRTWRPSKTSHKAKESPEFSGVHVYQKGIYEESRGAAFHEPGVVELKDGRIYSFIRTPMGRQYESFSSDCGETWTEPNPTELLSSCSPASIKRIPKTGDLLLVWNDRMDRYNLPEPLPESWDRTPFVCAVSRDEGRTWQNPKPFETDNSRGFCYATIYFIDDNVLLAYQSGGKNTGFVLSTNTTRIVDLEWLYS